ncbi:hypothetical protein [Neobacillus sp. YIM B06451]|uniref:hypothetical protein n=1 Tax=Neobacillus sp. YIM B06451 TaxID=3070994 RepID=UPI0029318DC6|nr:hypothetical protein [Neobacillus sp. YIM B06451]
MKMFLLSVIGVLSLLLGGCFAYQQSTNETESTQKVMDVREVAWNSLSNNEREEVIGGWKDAEVNTIIVDDRRFGLNDATYIGKEVTMVTFRSKKSEVLGNISKLVDENTQKVIGGAYRE